MFQPVKVLIHVDLPDDTTDPEGSADTIIASALQADSRIALVYVKRDQVLLEQ